MKNFSTFVKKEKELDRKQKNSQHTDRLMTQLQKMRKYTLKRGKFQIEIAQHGFGIRATLKSNCCVKKKIIPKSKVFETEEEAKIYFNKLTSAFNRL